MASQLAKPDTNADDDESINTIMIISHTHLLALSNLKGLGPKKIHSIVEFLRGEGTGQLSDKELCDIIHVMIQRKALKGIKEFSSFAFENAVDNAQRILDSTMSRNISMVSRYDESFPEALLKTVNEDGKESIPLFLFYKGNLSIANNKSIAIIGTREPSLEGEIAGKFFAKALAEKGVNIVSGLALGCDTAAHKGALEGFGVTTATLGNGLDTIYPPENVELAEQIVSNGGLLLSEYPVGEEATPYTLVARDRLQAALSQAVLVIQTAIKGGTMHAVNAASIAGKPVFAVEYKKNLSSEFISGNLSLIQQGIAKPISGSTDDVYILYDSLKTVDNKLPEGTQLSIF